MPTFFGVGFFDGSSGCGMVGEVVLESVIEAIGSFPGRTRRGERYGGRLDDQSNFAYRQPQLAAGLVFAARPVEHVAIVHAPTVKTFVGVTANAAKTRIRTAPICMRLRHLHLGSRFGWCPSNLGILMNLFSHRDLHA